ncbi:hypothetical protein BDV30DRAFT_232511 [Aspergillus minisclerotigenes]|uniref:Uncharacterized protein n=1 Tax=Aspergillus minisclerotigenes TaxID=656917 RepID=A0A5N6IHZ4_9EURO|nr:hypothetical protein BDV30DRAFT_232511 [Aspergillus minisclerotigenes]
MGERKRGVNPDGWDIPTTHCNTVFGAMMTRLQVEPWPTALVDGLGRSFRFFREISGMQVAGQGYKGLVGSKNWGKHLSCRNTRQSATQMLLGDFPTLVG